MARGERRFSRPARGKPEGKGAINLVKAARKPFRWGIAAPVLLLILFAAAAFAKFAVLDRMAVADAQRRELDVLAEKLEACKAQLEGTEAVYAQYAHLTTSGMTQEERDSVSRNGALQMLRTEVVPYGELQSWTLEGNRMTLTVAVPSLQDANALVRKIRLSPMAAYCALNRAASKDGAALSVTAELDLVLQNPAPREAQP